MSHLAEGVLRRLYDEPFGVSAADHRHYENCAACKARYEAFVDDARSVASKFAASPARVDTARAFAVVQHRINTSARPPGQSYAAGRAMPLRAFTAQARSWRAPLSAAALVAAVVGAVAVTPAGSMAKSLLTIFQPKTYEPIAMSTGDLQSLPDLTKFGTMSGPKNTTSLNVSSVAAAAAASGLHIRVPASLPAGVPSTVKYVVLKPNSATFTFSAAKVRAAAAHAGKAYVPMPAALDHSTLRLAVGPVVVATYGSATGADLLTVPSLVIVQAPEPVLASTGASVPEIERYLLSQPGVSEKLRAEIRAIGDPSTTLPIPIPINAVTADKVTIQGVQGLAIGDSTNLGSGVLWRKDGMVYVVAGAMPESKIMGIAASLH
ncbi:MAG: uncharacterized protein JWO59_3097 [Chloroflexi bacterium]|nr:uncharacterized protein [Chloroflexota bacterium]